MENGFSTFQAKSAVKDYDPGFWLEGKQQWTSIFLFFAADMLPGIVSEMSETTVVKVKVLTSSAVGEVGWE